jgi:signal transduction histidine kinase
MDGVLKEVSARRALTDASLDAERAGADAEISGAEAKALRELDDRIERDRLVADDRLLKFRQGADNRAARTRLASRGDSTVAGERDASDERMKVERAVTDDVLAEERRRSDDAVQTERREHEGDRARLETRRQDTDDQLSTERSGADDSVAALAASRDALALAQSEEGHRTELLAMVTHDLRSPLSVIVMNAHLIVENTSDDATREAAGEVVLAASRMDRLLTDLLDVVRIESGILGIVKRPHDIGVLALEVHRSYEPLFAARGVTFTVDPPTGPLLASFDHDRIVQVLSNLLSNAMKLTPRNGTVALHVAVVKDGVELTLKDDGPGIQPEALPRVFERFWQVDSSARRGLGLGLYICQTLVQAHGGHIGVESTYGKGATFRFTLPAG